MKTLTQNLDLINTSFNEFLTILNRNIGFLLKFYHEFSEKYHIFDIQSLFAITEITEICRISDVCISSKFEFKTFLFKRCFKLHCSYNIVQNTFSVLYEKILRSKKHQTKIYIFHTVISLWRSVIFVKSTVDG